jgi:uncharacterized FlaG/YvyC family protein
MAAVATPAEAVRPAAGQPVSEGRVNPRRLEFLRDESSGRVAVRTTDMVTGQTRTIPPEEMLKALAGIRLAIGLLMDRIA